MEWKNRKVLITGITGFIGSSLAKSLVKEGAIVTGIIHHLDTDTDKFIVDNCNLVFGEITDYKTICNAISAYEIDVIFHLAAYSVVKIAAKDPMTTYNINVMGTVSVLEAARTVGRCKSILVASSDKAYGDHEKLPYLETNALQPKNTYDTSKACTDIIARAYALNYDMPIIVTRCCNVYGPGDRNTSRILPNTIRLVSEGKSPILYGNIGTMEREFIYVQDVVDAYKFLTDKTENYRGEAFNIGTDDVILISELIQKICNKMKRPDIKPELVEKESIFKEIQKQYLDSTKIKNLGWSPKVSLEDGLMSTIDYYVKKFNFKKLGIRE